MCSSDLPRDIAWSAVIWKDVHRLTAPSINIAARSLRPLAKKWEHCPVSHHRRASLIAEQLRPYKSGPISFPRALSPEEGVGAFTMVEEQEILWCRNFDRPDPLGRVLFLEDKTTPPSRAYLKLWEAFCLIGKWPNAGEFTLDLGSCPGGWTWVLASLGARVLSVDRSPLDPAIAAMPGVTFRKGDAFSLKPDEIEELASWLCCDVICAPEKLLALLKAWMGSRRAERFLCTIKFQGDADPEIVSEFQKLGRVIHLWHNKHELTFFSEAK